ncbi:ISAs1 family transposase [Gordonia sp. HY366]|uniref:ISAs1 family transposase n=2 Tax=Gordonia liuliyuniae TaxID=2911517 RepID=A0ABS9IXU1_9ACTN|nr:ISAs1 family transposase [Gordonia liuliyuniae]
MLAVSEATLTDREYVVRSDSSNSVGGDYVFTVKNNTPTLRRKLKTLPWADVPSTTSTDRGRGTTQTRTNVPAWIEFPGASQVAQLRRTITGRDGRRTVEIVYLITSAPFADAPPAVLAGWVQNHWGIENRLHWVRDVTFDEDRSQVRTGNAPHVMASLRNTAIGILRLAGETNIAHACRHHARPRSRYKTSEDLMKCDLSGALDTSQMFEQFPESKAPTR